MGACNSKSSAESSAARSAQSALPNSPSVEELVANSAHGAPTTRERLAWWREGMQVSEVYEIMEIVGQGSMGEVAICRKKLDSSEKVDARTEDLVALSERDDDETVRFAAEISATLNAQYHADAASKPKSRKRRRYACKTLNTMWMKNSDIMEYLNEINILRDLDHPNIIQLFEVFSVKRKIWLIMELCTGGDLTARSSDDDMTEADVVIILEQILLAIKYMHKRNVCHRDIKLENILFADDTPSAQVKLIDFGLSNKFTKGQKMLQACGTVYTAAPEMLNGEGCTEQTDVWSIGVIAFILLSGAFPFLRGSHDLEHEGKKEMLANARFKFGPEWDERNISTAAKDFVAQCFQKRPIDRWSAAEALDFVQHMWIPHLESLEQWNEDSESEKALIKNQVRFDETATMIPPSPKSKREALTRSVGSMRSIKRIDSSIIEGMQRYAEYSELKKTILMTMAYTMDKSSLHELRDIFVVLDTQGSGTVTLVDLKTALLQVHSERLMDDETIEKLFHGIDVDCSGQIHWNEFLAAVVESQGLITMGALGDAFDRIDSSGKGYISREDLKNILGHNYQENVVDQMLDEADYKKNGLIDYSEFLRLMFDDPAKGIDTLGSSQHATDTKMAKQLGTIDPASRITLEQRGSYSESSDSSDSDDEGEAARDSKW